MQCLNVIAVYQTTKETDKEAVEGTKEQELGQRAYIQIIT